MAKERYHHGDLRGALLDAAETLVRERGADGWSLREASARVGVSPSAAYHHFGSRDALVSALSEVVLARLGNRLRDAMEAALEQGPERLAACGRAYVTWAVEDPAVARLVFRGGATTAQSTISPHPHDVLTTELDRLTESGHLPPGARPGAEFMVWAAIHGLAILLIDGLVHIDDREGIECHTERLVFATFNGLARETAPEPDRPTPTTTHTRRLTQSPRPPASHRPRPRPEGPAEGL